MTKIVSVHSFRGGTGKSNITANLAAALAAGGSRIAVVDTDIQSPGIHALFNLDASKVQHSLNDYLWGRCPIEDTAYDVSAVLRSAGVNQGQIFLVASSLRLGEIARILRDGYDVDMLNDGLQDLIERLQLDYLLIDTHNTEDALATMVEDAYVNHIPVMTGGVGKPALREFYSKYLIPQMPPDMELTPISRTIGTDRLVDEMVGKFTHTVRMDWMLPGIAPTLKRVEVPVVAIIRFRDGKLAHEHLYWDQASVLIQLGLLDPGTLPVVGVDSARKVLDPSLPSNALIDRASDRD